MSEDTPINPSNTVAYIRRSTFQQENEHQYQAIGDWLEDHDLDLADITIYSETASGADRNRDQLLSLMNDIENDDISHVIIWELSRIAREGTLAQQFFDACEEHEVTVHITSGSITQIKPDGSNRFVADILAAVYAEERRTLIRRTNYGLQRAREQDKWVGSPPLGFTTDDDGYLIPRLEEYTPEDDPDVEDPDSEDAPDPKDSFFAIRDALQRLREGDSQRSVARDLHASRKGIGRIYNDEQKRQRYLKLESNDDRVQSALDPLKDEVNWYVDDDNNTEETEEPVKELEDRINQLENMIESDD